MSRFKERADRPSLRASAWTIAASLLAGTATAHADVSEDTLRSLAAPDTMETSIGTLEFKDGVPSAETAQTVFDALDFTRALSVYNNSFRGASAYALRAGFQSIGAEDNTHVVIFSELMDSSSLFLTANADTIYYMATLDLTDGPMVIEQPPAGSAPSTTCGSPG